MTEFDISHLMFTYDDVPVRRWNTYETFETMIQWVEKHVGAQTEQNGFSNEIMRKGIGWEIRTKKRDSEKARPILNIKFTYFRRIRLSITSPLDPFWSVHRRY